MQIYGIDLSMEKFDVSYIDPKGREKKREVKNKLKDIAEFLIKVPEGALFCAEHTGSYGDLLIFLCNQMEIKIAMVPGYTIKHSLGMVKGKSDPIDASRIREYGERFYDKLTFKEYDPEEIIELKALHTLRRQMVKARKLLRTGNHSRQKQPVQSISVQRHVNQSLIHLDSEIENIEKEMLNVILSNEALCENYKLATSIKAVGPVITTELIIKTGNFKNIDTARKAASYAGVCPFPNESGKIVGKGKTSPFADKHLKSLLHMGAKSAVNHNKEYRLYYKKKQLEGKEHYLIMNNISNKLLRTIYSVIKNKTPYSQDYICRDPREIKKNNSSTKKVA